ncbi:FliM/FliN family flagellar motor switch protein [Sphingomonas sp.]|jgi:flagellar motor switch/type III secretory pathway protein FliN|uniref:FliM/FliN family flagellar motor switch protein n=1 Tax=Sphingomonas sp. TaxID=28214 RepID=UPI002E36201F|nr:FliM/FliN family flagellar motor switch protein [Sphingomonas sp.]HEX4695791.1 FliM/FliN family flagellar motor switch protein [Sphingomonas sp.]
MTLHRSWLPADAVARGLRDLPLRAAVRGWSAKWFAHGAADVAGDRVEIALRDLDAGAAWTIEGDMVLSAGEGAPSAVAALMYGTPPDPNALTPADRAALEGAADACLADLRKRLSRELGLDRPWRSGTGDPVPHAWWKFRVAAGGATLLRIAVSEALAVRHVRAGLPPADPRPAPRRIAAALDPQPISVSARVGAARLTTGELAALGIGDLLVLDRALGDPASIAVDHRPKPLHCTIDQQDERLRLVVI